MGELSSMDSPAKALPSTMKGGVAATLSRNAVASLARVAVNAIVALFLPAYLTHRLPVAVYGAWVLILQMSAYVSFLDFGVQSGVAKFVAEYEAKGDEAAAGRRASAGLVIMACASVLGILLTLIVVWQVPRLLPSMSDSLYRAVRISILLIGVSLAFGLVCSVFSAVFQGLQNYAIPMGISILNRGLYALVICAAVSRHGSLAAMGGAVALVNIATGLLQVVAWRLKAQRIVARFFGTDLDVLKEVLGYCVVLAIWSVGMLCVNGLDVTIIGYYDFGQTAYYSIASLPTSMIILILSSALGPFMPAVSALSTQRSPTAMGEILSRSMRYTTILILLTGLPLLIGGYWILRVWVGANYAAHSVRYLQVLVLATMLRNLCLPYAVMVIATGKQKFATAAAIAEAAVNLGSSIYLAHSMGAMGVALGTLLGSIVSLSMHFLLSMHYTFATISISRVQLFLRSILGPAVVTIPSALLLPICWRDPAHVLHPGIWCAWAGLTWLLVWYGSLRAQERSQLLQTVSKRLHLVSP